LNVDLMAGMTEELRIPRAISALSSHLLV